MEPWAVRQNNSCAFSWCGTPIHFTLIDRVIIHLVWQGSFNIDFPDRVRLLDWLYPPLPIYIIYIYELSIIMNIPVYILMSSLVGLWRQVADYMKAVERVIVTQALAQRSAGCKIEPVQASQRAIRFHSHLHNLEIRSCLENKRVPKTMWDALFTCLHCGELQAGNSWDHNDIELQTPHKFSQTSICVKRAHRNHAGAE